MYSKVTEELLTTTVTDYYAYLSKTGYMRYDKVCGILALAFVNRFLNSHLSVFVTEDDYRLLSRFLYTLIGRDCLIPWPEYTKQLPQTGGAVRDDIIPLRVDEGGLFRYVQKTPNPRTDDTSYTFWAPVPFRLYASPEGAEISINGESIDMVMCVPGEKVQWSVSKYGYESKEGSVVVTRPKVKRVCLQESGEPIPATRLSGYLVVPVCKLFEGEYLARYCNINCFPPNRYQCLVNDSSGETVATIELEQNFAQGEEYTVSDHTGLETPCYVWATSPIDFSEVYGQITEGQEYTIAIHIRGNMCSSDDSYYQIVQIGTLSKEGGVVCEYFTEQ